MATSSVAPPSHNVAWGDAAGAFRPPSDAVAVADDLVTALRGKFPSGAARLAEALRTMPGPGESAFGFKLVREIGRGAFGRVFLASQSDLAGRYVVVKVSADLTGESRALARLQHTNIVPIYSAHRGGALQAVCMPFLGATTFQGLLKHYRDKNAVPTTGRAFVETFRSLNSAAATRPSHGPDAPSASIEPTEAVLKVLAAGSYVRAVAWLIARLADGLAHAHDRGYIHRDIKPANVLLTDDGTPMLLDFGIAEEIAVRAAAPPAVLGGTLAYMAPEHLAEVRTGVAGATAASDVYSLGLVLYELLTGRFPFRVPTGPAEDEADRLIAERKVGPPRSVRHYNRDVSPGLESVVATCLAADLRRRYESAGALRDDLDRFLADRPLAVAPERSVREVVRKWARRHPRLTSTSTLGIFAAAALAAAGYGLWANHVRLARLEAEDAFRAFRGESAAARQLLYARPDDAAALAAGISRGTAAAARYAADAPGWDTRPPAAALPAAQQVALRRELADLYLMLARGHWYLAATPGGPATGKDEAVRLNALAGGLAAADPPRMLYVQRQTMFAALGRPADAAAATATLAAAAPTTARDYYAVAAAEQDAGRPAAAAALYRKAQAADPAAFWPHFGEGVCQYTLGQWAAARGCFTAALAIDPAAPFARFNRGLANQKLGDAAAAADDFSAALDATPDLATAYLARAEAREVLGEFAAGVADADAALGRGVPPARVLPVRARLRKAAGDDAGAAADARSPDTADGWILAGLDKLAADPAAALAAFDKAVALDPKSATARMYRAHVLGETGREAECAAALDGVLELDPANASAVAARGVMRARLKAYPAALADARRALDLSFAPVTAYQVAGIYALASRGDPAYRAEAVALLGIALRAGFGHDLLAADKELDPIRATPEFAAVAAAARRSRPGEK